MTPADSIHYNSNDIQSRFLGFECNQNRLAVPFWSWMAERYRPTLILELGTERGGFSCCLGIIAKNWNARFITVDHAPPRPELKPWFDWLQIEFWLGDVFSLDIREAAFTTIRKTVGRVFVLCDNGNKLREVELYAPMLRSGDIIAAHDFVLNETFWCWSEVTHETLDPIAAKSGFKPVAEIGESEKAAWLTYQKQ